MDAAGWGRFTERAPGAGPAAFARLLGCPDFAFGTVNRAWHPGHLTCFPLAESGTFSVLEHLEQRKAIGIGM